MLSTRRIVGIVMGVGGVFISVVHLVAAVFSHTPERGHGHEAIVLSGLVLAFVGILLLTDLNKR